MPKWRPPASRRLLVFAAVAHCAARRLLPRSNWEDGVFSRLELCFDEPDKGNTTVTLKQVMCSDLSSPGFRCLVQLWLWGCQPCC